MTGPHFQTIISKFNFQFITFVTFPTFTTLVLGFRLSATPTSRPQGSLYW
jgi:hypothetical protein